MRRKKGEWWMRGKNERNKEKTRTQEREIRQKMEARKNGRRGRTIKKKIY